MAKLKIQGKSANHRDNLSVGPKSPKKLPIQGSSANYSGAKVSQKRTPSPANKPYPAQTMNAPKPSGRTVLPRKAK
jgi:hypothetical protein